MTRKKTEQDFWEKVNKNCPRGCWLWTASTSSDGYGKLQVDKKTTYAHRFSWELHNGPIPNGLLVLHECDVPACVNPKHLFLGDNQVNADDKTHKGRNNSPRGEDHGKSKLTDEEVLNMREDRKNGMTVINLIEKYGISKSTVYRAVNEESWTHI